MTLIKEVKKVSILQLALVFSTLVIPKGVFADEVLSQATLLIQQAKPLDALNLLLPLESTRAGEKDFDYLLGVASLESGQPNEAIFALERAVSNDPMFGGAQLDLGRALFSINEFTQARQQFELVLSLSPPDHVVTRSREYLHKIDELQFSQRVTKQLTVEWSTGYDNNVNSSTYHDTFKTPYVTFLLNDNARAKASYFSNEKLSTEVVYATSRRSDWIIGANSSFSQYQTANDYNSTSASAYTQFRYHTSQQNISLSLARHQAYTGFDLNNVGTHVNGEIRHSLNAYFSLMSFSGISRVRYPGQFSLRDYNRFHIGSGTTARVNVPYPVLLSTSVVAAKDDTVIENSVWANDSYSFQINANLFVNHKNMLTSGLMLTRSHYREQFLGIIRDDYQANASLKYSAAFGKSWSVEPNASYVKNRSSVDLFDYDKIFAALAIKRVLL